jgi:hypothetical protein
VVWPLAVLGCDATIAPPTQQSGYHEF